MNSVERLPLPPSCVACNDTKWVTRSPVSVALDRMAFTETYGESMHPEDVAALAASVIPCEWCVMGLRTFAPPRQEVS